MREFIFFLGCVIFLGVITPIFAMQVVEKPDETTVKFEGPDATQVKSPEVELPAGAEMPPPNPGEPPQAESKSWFDLPANFWPAMVGTLVFGLLGTLGLIFTYWLFDWLTPKVDVQDQLNKGNLAVAIVVAALLLAAAFVVSHVVC